MPLTRKCGQPGAAKRKRFRRGCVPGNDDQALSPDAVPLSWWATSQRCTHREAQDQSGTLLIHRLLSLHNRRVDQKGDSKRFRSRASQKERLLVPRGRPFSRSPRPHAPAQHDGMTMPAERPHPHSQKRIMSLSHNQHRTGGGRVRPLRRTTTHTGARGDVLLGYVVQPAPHALAPEVGLHIPHVLHQILSTRHRPMTGR